MILFVIGITLGFTHERLIKYSEIIELFFLAGMIELIAELIYLACKL